MLVLGRYGLACDQVLAMTEPEVLGWLEAHAQLQKVTHPVKAAGGRSVQTQTSHIQSLRRKAR